MRRRQIVPRQWLIIAEEGPRAIASAYGLPPGSGVLLVTRLGKADMRKLCRRALSRGLIVACERLGAAERVHGQRELSRALLRRTPLIFLSPLNPTTTHPDWEPLPRMRAAALARLSGRRLVALGGMNPKRYRAIRSLGFIGWAGISAFRI
jgi:thiamine-phosphate pyrophosphorylase